MASGKIVLFTKGEGETRGIQKAQKRDNRKQGVCFFTCNVLRGVVSFGGRGVIKNEK